MAMRILKRKLFGEYSDHGAPPLISDGLVLRTLLTYLTARAGRFPRGLISDVDLSALKSFLSQHSDLSERYGVTEDDIVVLIKAVESAVQGCQT